MSKNIVLFITIISRIFLFPVGVNAELYPTFEYVSFTQDNKIIYFNKYNGKISELNPYTQDIKDISNIIPASTSILSISQDQYKILLYTPNLWFRSYDAPFYDSTRKVYDNQWWFYDVNTKEKKILNEKISLATWYSENEIIYVFNNKDISIAPVNNLNSFKTLYSPLPSNVDTSKIMVANTKHQIVPLKDGYIIGNNNKFKYIKNNNYNIVANPNLNIFLEYNNNQVKILDWSGNQKLVLDNLSIKNAVILNNTEFIILLQNGQLVKYNLQKQELARISIEPIITDIYSIGESDNSLLIKQNNEISLYNMNTKEKGVVLAMSVDDINNNANPTTPVEAETTSNNSNILLLIGGILFLVAGVGVFIWKLRRR